MTSLQELIRDLEGARTNLLCHGHKQRAAAVKEAMDLLCRIDTAEIPESEIFAESGTTRRLTVRDLCYTVFMRAKGKNDEDGGPTDWFNDTRPTVEKGINMLKTTLSEEQAGYRRSVFVHAR